MTEDYQQQADAAEREVADMERSSERVGEHIDETRKDWEAKLADPSVPGADGDQGFFEEASDPAAAGGSSELPPPDPYETD